MANKHRAVADHVERPTFEEYFPRLRRGHAGVSRCPAEGCVMNRKDGKGEQHWDRAANIDDWKKERGIA